MCRTCVNDMMQSYCKGINQFSLVIVPLFGTGNWAIDVHSSASEWRGRA